MSRGPAIAIVECGTGNLHSIEKAVRRLAPEAAVEATSDPARIEAADKVIFPGDGAFDHCMGQIKMHGIKDVLAKAAVAKPFLGICVGMQLLFEHSDEGNAKGLGVLPGKVRRFKPRPPCKIPHMGWNQVRLHIDHKTVRGIENGMRFYFVHSHYVQTESELVIGSCEHTEEFAAIAGRDNLLAIQFHPEKSHRQGLRILDNFLNG